MTEVRVTCRPYDLERSLTGEKTEWETPKMVSKRI
jgi:hypothetical protein